MGTQVIGDKKRRRAERETGLALNRVIRLDNHTWEGRVLTPEGHEHWRIDRDTWEHEREPAHRYIGCWSSCRELPPEHAHRAY